MSAVDSSPLPIPTFQSLEQPCPKHLLDFLLNFIQLARHQSPEALLHNSRKRWLSAFDTLNRSFLKPLELPEQFEWHMLHERTKLFEVTFELLYLLTTRCGEVLSYQEDLTKSMLSKLLDIASSLEVWLDVPDIPSQEDFPNPEKLYADCVKTINAMLRALAGCTKIDHEGRAGWQILRNIGEECLTSCIDLIAAPPDALYHIRLFSHPKIRTGHPPNPVAEDAAAGSPTISEPNNYLEHAFICVHSSGQTPLMLTLLLELLLNTLNARHLEQTFNKSLTVRTAEVTCRAYDFLVSPACLTSDVKRARAMTRLVNAVCTGLQSLEPFNAISDPMRLHLLIRRLNDGPSDAWTKSDAVLVHAFSTPFVQPTGRPDVLSVLMLLKDEQWGDDGQNLRLIASAYLQAAVQTLDERTVAEVAAFLNDKADNACYAGLRKALDTRARAVVSQDVEMADDTSAPDWRREVSEIVCAIVQPTELDWQDDDGSTDDVQFVRRALIAVDKRFGPIYNPSAPARLALLQQLVRFPCALTRHAPARCLATTPTASANTLRACHAVLECVLEGPEQEVTPIVRKTGYDALVRALRHQPPGYCSKRLMPVMDVIRKGLKDVDRNVRMSAGRCLVELVNVYLRFTIDPEMGLDNLFKRIQELLDNGQERWKEAIVLALGQIAKTPSTYVLGKVLYCLVNQLGCSNPILRGIVSMQLAAAAKYHKKPAFNLLAPYLDTLAPRMVTRLKEAPSMLLEVCNFVCSTPQDFLVLLLPHTLPALYARCDRETIETLAHELKTGAAQLIVENGYKILPHILLLSAPGHTRRALDFTLSFFPRSVTVKDILQGHTTEIAIALILLMGEDDPATVHDAKDALMKMQQFLDDKTYTDADVAIRICLDEQFLAVMNRLTDHLQGSRPIDKKSRVIKALREIILVLGNNVVVFAPQIMATMQTALSLPDLAETTLKAWDTFFRVSNKEDLGSYVRATSAGFVSAWPKFSPEAKELATNCLEFVLSYTGDGDAYKRDIVDLSSIPELKRIWSRVLRSRANMTPHDRFTMLLDRINSDNAAVILLALQELKNFLLADGERLIRGLTSGDMFDPLVGKIIPALFSIAGKDHEGTDGMRLLALECIGICGAIDPDRFACDVHDSRMTVKNNFEDEGECLTFALHVMRDMLVPAFRSTYDIAYQNTLAYIIQQLARFCRFTRSLTQDGPGGSLPIRSRSRWGELPRSVRDVVGPLIESKYSWAPEPSTGLVHPPVYPARATYREWLQEWTRTLIARATGVASQIFAAFRPILDSQVKDVTVAYHIFPHLVLNGILSGNEAYVDDIRAEIFAVLEDQVDPRSTSTVEKRELCAQAIFMLMDHLNGWIHNMRQEISTSRKKNTSSEETRILQVESVLTSIDRGLVAKAALRCKAYARALMCYEQQLWDMGSLNSESDVKNTALETLHEIYAQLDEPDGMEGVSAKILSPSLEHQIREHESTGRWTSAQSCWEVRLQQSPGDLQSHLGLLRCLRNLGHYDTMRTHVEGLLVRNPAWQADLIEYQVESSCIVGDWPTVQTLVEQTKQTTSPFLLAQVLLAMRSGDEATVRSALQVARRILGSPITAAGARGYRHSYPAVLDLHILHELEIIFAQGHLGKAWREFDDRLESLQDLLAQRLDSTLPTFRSREPVLSIRRTALSLQIDRSQRFRESIGRSWLLTARLARKAGYKQTAYSALLQAQQLDAPYWFVQSAKLSRAMGDPLRAVNDIENWLGRIKAAPAPMTQGLSAELTLVRSKVTTLCARWLAEMDRYDPQVVLEIFKEANKIAEGRESGYFYLARFHDECAKTLKPPVKASDSEEHVKAYKAELKQYLIQRLTMSGSTIHALMQACETGTKYIYQALPRALTIFLNVGDENEAIYTHSMFKAIVTSMIAAAKDIPSYKWYIAFPQIISRIVHHQDDIYKFLKDLIRKVILDHPNQALWQFSSALQSKEEDRRTRADEVLKLVKSSGSHSGIATLIEANVNLEKQLLKLCERPIPDQKWRLTMRQHFSFLANVTPSPCIIPLQESLIAAMPTSPSLDANHQPFPADSPTFHEFMDDVEIMQSLAKPRKITIIGSNGRQYSFLGKPKDDLRKDARIMDFNAIINKQLKANANTRRRQMYIRTYGVVTLNEECGFIQWVPNTMPVRNVLIKAYVPPGLLIWIDEQNDKMRRVFEQITAAKSDKTAAELFQRLILDQFPPVLHEWFLHMFPEPTKWLSTRLAYTRTCAVMCMVGWILGMGDRHGENLLLDTRTGDIVHVDFNCLFERGRKLNQPEKVPFRLTQNIVAGFGVTGTEGVFRIACELALQTLRDNRECLMTILDAFIHDPLVEWYDQKKQRDAERRKEEEKRRMQEARRNKSGIPQQQESGGPEEVNLEELAREALEAIHKKLRGVYASSPNTLTEKEISTSSLVGMLITEATDLKNLSRMYAGWSPHL